MKAGCPAHQNTTKPTCSILVTGIRVQMEDPSKLSYDSPGPTKNHSLFQEDKAVSDIIIQGRVTPCMFPSGQLLHVDASESSVDLCLCKDKPPMKHTHPSGGQGSTLKDTIDCRNQVFDACLNIADGENTQQRFVQVNLHFQNPGQRVKLCLLLRRYLPANKLKEELLRHVYMLGLSLWCNQVETVEENCPVQLEDDDSNQPQRKRHQAKPHDRCSGTKGKYLALKRLRFWRVRVHDTDEGVVEGTLRYGQVLHAFLRSMVLPCNSSGPQERNRRAKAAKTMSMPIGWMVSSIEFVEFTKDSEKSSMGLVL